jgi:hypothetical protein
VVAVVVKDIAVVVAEVVEYITEIAAVVVGQLQRW